MDIRAIRLYRNGNYTVVAIQIGNSEYDVIRDLYENNFDHTITDKGMKEEVNRIDGLAMTPSSEYTLVEEVRKALQQGGELAEKIKDAVLEDMRNKMEFKTKYGL